PCDPIFWRHHRAHNVVVNAALPRLALFSVNVSVVTHVPAMVKLTVPAYCPSEVGVGGVLPVDPCPIEGISGSIATVASVTGTYAMLSVDSASVTTIGLTPMVGASVKFIL